MNIPFTHEQVRILPKGFNPSCNELDWNAEEGRYNYAPNRRQRRAHLNERRKRNNRKQWNARKKRIQARHQNRNLIGRMRKLAADLLQ